MPKKNPELAIGIHHGIEDINQLKKFGQLAEERGFESIWVTEDYFSEETFSLLGALAAVTENIGLGVGVVNPYTRNPALLAMAAATLDRISRGRFLLGLGRSEKERIEGKMGISYGDALAVLEECTTIVRAILSGERVDFTGRTYSVRDVFLRFKPLRKKVPIYYAATGQKTLSLTGRLADGVLLNVYSPLGYVRYAVDEIRRAAEQAGRNPNDVDIACFLSPRVTDDINSIMKRLKLRLIDQILPRGVGELLLEKGGYDTGILDPVRRLVASDRQEAALGLINHDMVQDFCVAGSIADCERRVEDYRKAGVDTPILLPRLEQYETVAKGLGRV